MESGGGALVVPWWCCGDDDRWRSNYPPTVERCTSPEFRSTMWRTMSAQVLCSCSMLHLLHIVGLELRLRLELGLGLGLDFLLRASPY